MHEEGSTVHVLAQCLFRTHDMQYSSDHLSWRDFADEAKEYLDALAEAGFQVVGGESGVQ